MSKVLLKLREVLFSGNSRDVRFPFKFAIRLLPCILPSSMWNVCVDGVKNGDPPHTFIGWASLILGALGALYWALSSMVNGKP